MTRPHRPLGRGARLSKRWLGWSTGSSFHTISAGSQAVALVGANMLKDTILRTRGNLICWVDGAEAPAVSAIISVGMHIVPEGTGTTVTVEPFGDANANWFYYDEFVVGYEESVTDVISVQGLELFRSVIDDKAMRIGVPDTEIQFVMTNTTLNGALSVNLTSTGRFLLGS